MKSCVCGIPIISGDNMAALPSGESRVFRGYFAMISTLCIVAILLLHPHGTDASQQDLVPTFDVLFNAGVEAYLQERWQECLSSMQSAVTDYKYWHDYIIDCRLRCQAVKEPEIDPSQNLELAFLEKTLRSSDCLRRCKKHRFPGRPESINREVLISFENLQVYDYIQICAYKVII